MKISTEMCLVEQMFGDVMEDGINSPGFWMRSICLCDAIINTSLADEEDV